MKVIKEKDNKLIFSAEISNSLANAIRRHVHEIPTVAVDEVEISKNDSALHDETIAHRIGLVPFKNGKDGGEISLKVNKEGTLYAKEIEGDAKAAYENMPITLLKKNQEIDIKGSLRAGKGNEHSKFVPGILFYRNEKEITLPQSLKKEIQEAFPDANLETKGQKIILKDTGEKDISNFCEGLAEKKGENFETKETGNLIFHIESFGQMSPREIFKKSIEQLKGDLGEFSSNLK